MNKDISYRAKTCLACQRAKIHRHVKNIPEHIPIPDGRFQHIHLDIVGPLPRSRNFLYCLTIIDRYTRWPEAIPLTDISADTVTKAFYDNWVARFGAPVVITTDRGSQFESNLFQGLVTLLEGSRNRTTTYHPESNGLIERWHRSLKTAIKCHQQQEWVDILPTILLGLRTSYKEDLKATAAEMLYGTSLRLPGEFFLGDEQLKDPDLLDSIRSRL